ncbi:MAG: hypothetical protein KKC46_17845 [Proteobacteria bacterium]|nr:hypothetical protein [Pseudomonadota bacterium]
MKMYSKEGVEMMDMLSMSREGENLVVKGKMMGAMLATIYVKPKDLWQSLGLLSFSIIVYMPVMLVKGFLANKKDK